MSKDGSSGSSGRFTPNVLHVTAELAPYAKTGGLGDMVSAIVKAVSREGARCTILVPAYDSLRSATSGEQIFDLGCPLGDPCQLIVGRQGPVRIAMLRCDPLWSRPGGIYGNSSGVPWPDNTWRFGLLSKVAALIASGMTPLPSPDVVHLHDWHAGMYFAFSPPPAIPTLLTVHNFSFQGRFDASWLAAFAPFADIGVIESGSYFKGYSPLKIASDRADILTTVSEGYRHELQSSTRFNWFQLSNRNRRRLRAIQNWVDQTDWNPSTDPALDQCFDSHTLGLRTPNRLSLVADLGLTPQLPVACTVSRLTRPKGFNFLLKNLDTVTSVMSVVFVGDGEPKIIRRIQQAAANAPDRIRLVTPYSETVARRCLAGADFLLMPSLVEPSGLSQMQALAYGCIPIVSATGGLPASLDGAGILFLPSDRKSLSCAVESGLSLFNNPSRLRELQAFGMRNGRNGRDGSICYMKCYVELIAGAHRRTGSGTNS